MKGWRRTWFACQDLESRRHDDESVFSLACDKWSEWTHTYVRRNSVEKLDTAETNRDRSTVGCVTTRYLANSELVVRLPPLAPRLDLISVVAVQIAKAVRLALARCASPHSLRCRVG